MSFVDLMADLDWSDMDIKNRTEAVIASEFPPVDYAILSRKVDGTRFGYVLTDAEQAQLSLYQQIAYQAGAEADAARADMELLRAAWRVEQGDAEGATPEVLELVAQRAAARPVNVPEETPADPPPETPPEPSL